nr:MAG: capsid protein [ssDNA virus sp.]
MDVQDTIDPDTTGAGAGDTMPTVRIQETYDLGTTVNRFGMIGIHTPSMSLIAKLYAGLMLNYKHIHLDKCDFAVACASVLPADPLQVGTEAGSIAPQDMFNPILYRAVSNESYNTILNRVYATDYVPMNTGADGSVSGPGTVGNQPFTSPQSNFEKYYALLGDSGWKKAMPQSGFAMTSLVPLVYNVVNNFGDTYIPSGTVSASHTINTTNVGGSVSKVTNLAIPFHGHSMPMPRIPTVSGQIAPTYDTSGLQLSSINMPELNSIPKTYVAVIVTPPAKQHILYYRLRVVWTITFSEPVSLVERASLTELNQIGTFTYTDDTGTVSNKNEMFDNPEVSDEMVDANGMSADMIMQR